MEFDWVKFMWYGHNGLVLRIDGAVGGRAHFQVAACSSQRVKRQFAPQNNYEVQLYQQHRSDRSSASAQGVVTVS
jgi:hypothetical protein